MVRSMVRFHAEFYGPRYVSLLPFMVRFMVRFDGSGVHGPLPREEGTTENVEKACTLEPRPESGLD